MPAQVIPATQPPAASSPVAAAAATAARRPIRKWVLLGIAALLAVALVAVGGVVMVNQPWRKVGFNATVHAAGPDMPKLCQSLLGSDKDVSKAFGLSVTATDPGDKADTGVCMYRDDSGTDHEVGVGYAPQPHADGDAEVPDDAASADVERVSATSRDGRYAVSLKDDSSVDEEASSRLRSLFQKAADRLTDDTAEWSSSLPKLDSGATLIPSQSVCDGRACNGEETQSSAQTSAQASGGADQSKGQSKNQSNQAKGDDSGKSGKSDKSNQSDQSSGKSDGKSDAKSGTSGESDKDAADKNGVTTGVGGIAFNVPTAYAYDTSLALLDHPKAVKAKLEDGSTQYVMPADGESFTLLDFRRSPGNACAKDVCTWKGDASKEATLKVGGKANDGAGRVLKGVVGSNVAAHGAFVVSGAADAELRLDVKAGKQTYSATMKADVAGVAAGAGADGSGDAGSDGQGAKPTVDAEKAKKAAIEGVGAHDDACQFGCTATGVVPFEHPVWGTSYLVTVAMGAKAKAPANSDVDGYDYAYGFAVVGQSGQAMYGSSVFPMVAGHEFAKELQSRFNILPALDKPDKAGNILLAEYVYGGGSGVSDTLQALHVGADGTLKALDVRKGEPTSYVDQTITDKGDADGDGLADLTMRMGDTAGGAARFSAWRGTYRWAWNAKDSAYEFTALEPSKEDAITNAELFATNLYKGTAEDMATHLSDEAEIFSWGECAVKQVADIQPFDVKEGGPGGVQTRHIDDPVKYSLDMSSFFAWFGGRGKGQPVDNLLANGGDGSVEYCKLLHTSGGGGLGGTSNMTNSLDFGDATYDAKSRTAKLQATVTWTAEVYGKGKQETVTNPTITVVFDKKGLVKRVDTTAWGVDMGW